MIRSPIPTPAPAARRVTASRRSLLASALLLCVPALTAAAQGAALVASGAPTSARASAADSLEAAVRQARDLAWAGRHADAIAAYDRVLAATPAHREATLGRAITLAWADRHGEALLALRALQQRAPGRDADRAIARVLAWQGEHTAAEQAWRRLLDADAGDAEAWGGLAQVQFWMRRTGDAARSIARARALAPADGDLAELATRIHDARRTTATPRVMQSEDTDGNVVSSLSVEITPRTFGALQTRGVVNAREARFGPQVMRAMSGHAELAYADSGDVLYLVTQLGAATLGTGQVDAVTRPLLVFRAAARPTPAVRVGLTVRDVPFDETATMIARGLHLRGLGTDVAWTLPHRVTLDASIDHAHAMGTEVSNERLTMEARAQWTARERQQFSLAVRSLGWDTLMPGNGYFAPHALSMLELGARQEFGAGAGLGATFDGGFGPQRLQLARTTDPRLTLAARGSIALHYATTRGYLLEVVGGASSLASAMTRGDRPYRLQYLAVRMRSPF